MSDGSMSTNEARRVNRPRAAHGRAAEVLGLAGVVLLAIGCGLVYTPLAFIAVGVLSLAGGILLARRS